MNAATAAGIVGGPVATSVRTEKTQVLSCEFAYQKGHVTRTLRIRMIDGSAGHSLKSFEKPCVSKASPVSGIGDEAALCDEGRGAALAEEIVSRVRDEIFSVVFSVSEQDGLKRDVIREKASAAAEQVAGMLF
jgi:hypothetical protein